MSTDSLHLPERTTARFTDDVLHDARFGLRMLRKNPTFTLAVVLTLAVAIGGDTAMFSLIRGVLLKPLEYQDSGRLVSLVLQDSRNSKLDGAFSLHRLEQMRASAKTFNGIGAFLKGSEDVSLSGEGEPEALRAARVSANFLAILEVKPLLGRGFLAEEDTLGGPAVAMISSRLWRRRFHSDPRVVGTTVTLEATPYTIIGVVPDGFAFPFVGTDVWLTRPAEASGIPPGAWPFVTTLNGFARLKPQTSLSQAQAELDVLNRQYLHDYPKRLDAGVGVSMRLVPMRDRLVADVRPTLWMLFGAVGFILLIACANVASILLARATSRSHEFALRAALGGSRGRLVRQLLTESVILALGGGALGVILAKLTLSGMKHFSGFNLPRSGEIRLDSMVLGFTLFLSIATGFLFGLFPSLRTSRRNLATDLQQSGTGSESGSLAQRRVFGISMHGLLVVGQIALSVVLIIGAALTIKSFVRLRDVYLGFQPADLLTMKISLPQTRYDTNQKRAAFYRDLLARVQSLPGVRNAAAVLSLPTKKGWLGTNVSIEGQDVGEESEEGSARIQGVTPGYFRTLGIPLLRGRVFTDQDNDPDAEPKVIINESFALQFWPSYPRGLDPVGQHIREGIDKTDWVEIVGIVGDVNQGGPAASPVSEFYVPTVVHAPPVAYLAVRTEGEPSAFVGAVREQVLHVDQDQPVSDIQTMEQLLESTLGQRRLRMCLLGSFAGVALLLAAVGIYGLIAYSVSQRTREVGVRQALGAQRGDILKLVLKQALSLALTGVVIGVGGALALTRVMQGLLFNVSATDPMTFVTVVLLFIVVSFLASYIPARRAVLVDPMTALRAS